MRITSLIKQSAMWLLFAVQLGGTDLPNRGSERQIPLWVALIINVTCLALLGLLALAAWSLLNS